MFSSGRPHICAKATESLATSTCRKAGDGNFAYKTDTKNGEISLEVVIFSAQFFSGNEMHLDPSGAGRRSEDFTCTISELLGEFWTDVFAWARSNFDSQDGHVSLFSLL